MRRPIWKLLVSLVAASSGLVFFGTEPASALTCASPHNWPDGGTLQAAVDAYQCVQITPGTYNLGLNDQNAGVTVWAGRVLRGVPGQASSAATLRAGSGMWNVVVYVPASEAPNPPEIYGFTVDAASTALGGIGGPAHIHDMIIGAARCWGVAVVSAGSTITNNIIQYNGYPCEFAPPGAAIYAISQVPNVGAAPYAPYIAGNTIQYNYGPGLDVEAVWYGTFSSNTLIGNGDWAGVSLYQASYWNISNNYINHPAGNPVSQGRYHPDCTGGPGGVHPAAIFLCTDGNSAYNRYTVYNTISNNTTQSWYGILLIGQDNIAPWRVPRLNYLSGNNPYGSYYGCADDMFPNQWYNHYNTWTSNAPGCGPTYF